MAKKTENQQTEAKEPISVTLEEVLPDSMVPYAESVILDRALPRVEDGLKPVQRRILYTMNEMGVTPDKPHKKCARIVGDCMGKYHPHGDSSVYDALVRLAQDFNMRMRLVDGHGNFGSVDGDSAAAMRYTEARLEPLAMELLRDIDKDTVDFTLNFDDSLEEPTVLPGRFPNLLVNGANGIAVGFATNIPTHNLGEVIDGTIAYIDNDRITLPELMRYIPAPDFPTGGFIVCDEMEQIYATGHGKIVMRAKVSVQLGENEKKLIVITELPYQVNKSKLLQSIVQLKEDKKEMFAGIVDVVDESDRTGMRAVITVRKDADDREILENLFKYTDLETTIGVNMVAIAEGKPQQLGLIALIRYYVQFQQKVILRRSKFDLAQAKERSHILEGLIVAVRNIDEIVRIIKTAESTTDAKQKLRAKFALSEKQAQAILDLRLARLTKLEVFKLEKELEELRIRIAELTEIVNSPQKQLEVVKNELKDVKKRYKSPRKTVFAATRAEVSVPRYDDVKEAERLMLCMTAQGKLKCLTERSFSRWDKKPADRNRILTHCTDVMSDSVVLAFTNRGNCHKFDMENVPRCTMSESGFDFADICPEAERDELPVSFFALEKGNGIPDGHILLFTKGGMIKRTEWREYDVSRYSFQAIRLKEGDSLLAAETDTEGSTILFVTEGGMCLNALKDDIPVQGRVTGGVKGISLTAEDRVLYVTQTYGEGELLLATNTSGFKRVDLSLIDASPRYRKGFNVADARKDESVLFAGIAYTACPIAIESATDAIMEIETENVPAGSKTSWAMPLFEYPMLQVKSVWLLPYKN